MASLVSIIIPCYNAERWIAQAIQSALDQTWPNKEIIVIDDGSKDSSLDALNAFGEKIRFESGPNRGGCAARNRGIEMARGDWVQFLDADDVMLPDCIAAKMATPHAANERVCCAVAVLESELLGHISDGLNLKRYETTDIIRIGTPQTSQPLHRREDLLKVNGFRIGLPCAQEFDLHLRMAVQLGLILVSHGKTGVLLRQRKGSVSDLGHYEMPLVHGQIVLNALNLIKTSECDRDRCVDAAAQRLALLGRQLHRMGRPEEATRFADEAKRISKRWYGGVYKSWPATVLARTIGFAAFESLHTLYRTFRGKRSFRV